MIKQFLTAAVFALSAAVLCDDNIVNAYYFKPALSYYDTTVKWRCGKNQQFTVKDGIMTLAPDKNSDSARASLSLSCDYSTADTLAVSFLYRSKGKNSISISFYNPEKRLQNRECVIPDSAEWKQFSQSVPFDRDAYSSGLSFHVTGKETFLEVKDLIVTENEPAGGDGKPLMLSGRECKAIFYCKSDESATYYDRRAARILRYCLAKTGGRLIPIVETKSDSDYSGEGIFVGKAAEKTGLLSRKELDGIREGGYAMRCSDGRLAIAGARPSGTAYGAVEFLKRVGIRYLAQNQFSFPQSEKIEPENFTESRNPAVPMRELSYRVGTPELYGYTSHDEFADFSFMGGHRGNCHSMLSVIPLKEFQDVKPDFFAMGSDGKRMHTNNGIKPYKVQYCLSNTKLHELAASRIIELMKADPYARYFYLFPGDGGDSYCKCKSCEALGSTTDRLLVFINAVAEITGKIYPDKYIMTLAYVDSCVPPVSQKPRENVLVLYTPYTSETWGSHLIFQHAANKTGLRHMAEWEKLCQANLGAFTYPSSCSESQNIWPAFQANYEFSKHFAEKGYRGVAYCGLVPTQAGGGLFQMNSFTDLQLKILAEVLCNPDYDIEKGIREYMDSYFGPASQSMYKYFSRIRRFPKETDWEQNTEKRMRGVITPEFASECLQYLDEAEKAAGNDARIRRNVIKEKYAMLWSDLSDNCRGRGKVGKNTFPVFAKRLAEFAKIAKELDSPYFGYTNVKQWFWDVAMLDVKDTPYWYNEPVIGELIRDPEKTIGATLPITQEKSDGGYVINAKGMFGGEGSNSSWFRADRIFMKILRRQSSTFGTVQFMLKLPETPKDAVTLKIYGIDNEKPEPSRMELIVNEKSIYQGNAPWEKNRWSEKDFIIPAGLLQQGENIFTIMNITPDTEKDGEGGANFVAKRNYTWGWFALGNARFIMPDTKKIR